MPRAIRILALLLAVAAAAPARADQVHFTGTTSVDNIVIRDALQNIALVAASRGCTQITAVEARLLPADYRPTDADQHGDRPGLRYERWDVTLCGAVLPFLLAFWQPPEGGTMFQITLPYPADAPPPAT
jgi:hypothetical protein